MYPLKIEHEDMKKAIESGHLYIQVGNRKFLLMEVEEVNNDKNYEVIDPEEEKLLISALNDYNPLISEEAINRLLGQ